MMRRMGGVLLILYLTIVAVVSVWFAAVTLTMPDRPVCKPPECQKRLW
jgi:hypothetical protein